MQTLTGVRFADLTTLRVGGPAARLVEVDTETDLVDAVLASDAAGKPAVILGGGSNLLVSDAGYDGTVIAVRTRGVTVEVDSCAGAWLSVAAGEPWDGVVERAVVEGWVGLEMLSGIPGLAGAAPIQNIGAYGGQLADTVARVRTLDRRTGQRRTFAAADCGFAYRTSLFKGEPGRYVVLGLDFQLTLGDDSAPILYPELAAALGVAIGDRAPLRYARAAVLELRSVKGMLLEDSDHDTWSAGSFFLNPILDPGVDLVPPTAPRFPQPDGRVKTSAAWLIEQAGFPRGYPGPEAPARLSTRHTLAVTNTGDATASDVLALARELRDGVRTSFGIDLEPEPSMLGCDW